MHHTVALTVPRLLAERAEIEPDRAAVVVDGRGELAFGEWDSRSDAVARGLLERGLRPGDRVGLLFGGERWIDYAIACCGVQKAGGVAVPLSDRLADAEVADIVRRCSAVAVLHHSRDVPPVECWTARLGEVEADDRSPVGVDVSPDQLAQIIYTSGTTGTPKGVGASHANLTHGHVARPRHRAYAHSRLFLHAFPIGTNAAQMMLMDALTAHPAALALARFDAEEFCRLVEAYRVGTAFLVPSMAIELLGSAACARHDLSSLVLVGSSAAALPPAVATDLAAAFPRATIVNYYTSTEAVPARTAMILDPKRPASLGRATDPGDLRVCDGEGRVLPAGEAGEIWLRSPAPPRSYVDDPAGSAEVFRDGWVRMGDVGYLDQDGYLFLVDRQSDVIKSGGLKVSTLRIEEALHEHPAVAEAAVVGVPHSVMGSVPAAAVRLRRPVPFGELREFLAGRLARHQMPTRIVVVEDFARGAAGKILKPAVRELFADRGRRVPLSAAQEAWFASGGATAEPVEMAIRLRGGLDPAMIRRALHEVAGRHEALRLTFPPEEGGDAARIVPGLVPEVLFEESVDGTPPEAVLAAALARPFDSKRGPLLRAVVTPEPPDGHLLGLTAHPLVCDEWSLDVILQELAVVYGATLSGQLAALPPPGRFDEGAGERSESAAALTLTPAALAVPLVRAAPPGAGTACSREFDPSVAGAIRRTAGAARTGTAAVALAAWGKALAELTAGEPGEPLVLVGSPARQGPGAAALVGPVARNVPVVVSPEAGVLERVREALAESPPHLVWDGFPAHTGRFTFQGLRPEPYWPGGVAEPLTLPPRVLADAPPRLVVTERPDGSLSCRCAGPSARAALESFTRHLSLLVS
ncbi:AMP-binding protein [Microbispora sp. ZYX-F-249]|uniref:AMP-binding protein n=1 Tax=Microbispora maris TaxID=3144104 RepID=A0ABV0B2B8_9ACTN